MNIKRVKGDVGEAYTAKWLRRHLYKIIDTNYSCRFGEVDIIALSLERSRRSGAITDYAQARVQLY